MKWVTKPTRPQGQTSSSSQPAILWLGSRFYRGGQCVRPRITFTFVHDTVGIAATLGLLSGYTLWWACGEGRRLESPCLHRSKGLSPDASLSGRGLLAFRSKGGFLWIPRTPLLRCFPSGSFRPLRGIRLLFAPTSSFKTIPIGRRRKRGMRVLKALVLLWP